MPYRIILAAIMYRFYDFRIWAVQVVGRGGEKERFPETTSLRFQPASISFSFDPLHHRPLPSFFNSLCFSLSLPLLFLSVPRESLYRDRGEYRKFSGILTLPINALTGACTRLEDFRFPFPINAIAKNAIHTILHGVFHHQDLERETG